MGVVPCEGPTCKSDEEVELWLKEFEPKVNFYLAENYVDF